MAVGGRLSGNMFGGLPVRQDLIFNYRRCTANIVSKHGRYSENMQKTFFCCLSVCERRYCTRCYNVSPFLVQREKLATGTRALSQAKDVVWHLRRLLDHFLYCCTTPGFRRGKQPTYSRQTDTVLYPPDWALWRLNKVEDMWTTADKALLSSLTTCKDMPSTLMCL